MLIRKETAGARLANMFKRAAGQSHPPHRRGGWRGRRSNTNAGLSIPVRAARDPLTIASSSQSADLAGADRAAMVLETRSELAERDLVI
jgi:hypothetical protein